MAAVALFMVGRLAKFNDIFTSTVPTINNFSNHALRINCLTLFVQLKIQNNILFLYTTGHLQGMWFSRSMDEGRTWTINKTPGLPGGQPLMIPYGKIICHREDGKLNAAAYLSEGMGRLSRTWFLQSDDGGDSWSILSQIGNGDTNETALLRLSDGQCLAAARTHVDHHVELYRSDDGGNSWSQSGPLTLPRQHPADLLLLPDGVILLTYGLRNRGLFGIGGRISENQGATWSAPFVMTQFGEGADCGYPSSIHTKDGTLVTAYYSDRIEGYSGYHMGILRWRSEESTRPRQF